MDPQQVNSVAVHGEPDPAAAATTSNNANRQVRDGNKLEKPEMSSSTVISPEETYPEGGFQAWTVVLGSWLAMFASLGIMNTIGIFQAYTLSHQLSEYSEGTIGWVFSIYTFLAFFCGVYIGPIFDKYGPRWLVAAGSICTVCGMVGMSFSHELWHFILSFGILNGFGSSLLFTPSIAAIGHWFKARRGFATGLACTAGGIGGVVFPLMLTSLFDKIGYGWSTRALALISLVCSATSVLLIRSRLPPAKNATAHPDFRIFGQLPFLFATLGIFLLEFSLFIPLTYISSFALYKGFSEDFAFHLLPILNAASTVGRALPGYYADVIGPFNVCILSVILSIVGCLCVWLPLGHTSAGIIVFAVIFGFASGTGISIAPVCIGTLCKTQEYGRYYATTYTVVSFACLIGVPIGGSIVQANGGAYTGLMICTAGIYVGSVVFLVLAKISKVGLRGLWTAF